MSGILPRNKRSHRRSNRYASGSGDVSGRPLEPDFLTTPYLFGDLSRNPLLDICESRKDITVKAEIPGIDTKDLDISINGRRLSIKGEKKQEKRIEGESYYRVERSYGSFDRTIELPAEVDPKKVDATYRRGVLKVNLRKAKSFETRRVQVNSG